MNLARRAPRRKWGQAALKQALCLLLCLVVLIPFYVVVINAFKTKGEAARMNINLPAVWVFSNFAEVINKGKLLQGFLDRKSVV